MIQKYLGFGQGCAAEFTASDGIDISEYKHRMYEDLLLKVYKEVSS